MPSLPPFQPPKPNTYDEFEDGDEETENNDREYSENEEEEDEEELRMRRAQARARRDMEEQENERVANKKQRSLKIEPDEPKVENPYEHDETSYLIPILVAIGAFIPLLFCLCKL